MLKLCLLRILYLLLWRHLHREHLNRGMEDLIHVIRTKPLHPSTLNMFVHLQKLHLRRVALNKNKIK